MTHTESFFDYFKGWIPETPSVLDRTKNSIRLSWRIEDPEVKLLENCLLYKIQTHEKLRGWFDVYCGGRQSKIIDNLSPSRPHKFRLKVLIRPSAIAIIRNDPSLIKELGSSLDTETNENSRHEEVENSKENYARQDPDQTEVLDDVNNDITNIIATAANASRRCIQSRWSEEFQASTLSEGPSVVCFYMAVRCGYLKQVQQMLEDRPSLISICNNTDGFTPLATAVRKGNMSMVKYLMSNGADVNQKSLTGQAPLHVAVYSKNLTLAEYLLEHGADRSIQDINGLSMLHYAVDAESADAVQFALDRGGDVDSRDSKGWTPLMRAVMQGTSADVVQLLLAAGSDPELTGNSGHNSVQYAALLKRRDDIRRLVDRNFIRHKAVFNFTKLTKKISNINTMFK